jgi:hypothetical protein
MKRFILHSLLFILVVALSFLGVLSLADGETDQLYLRFTTPRQENLILGTSRAAQAIQPTVMKEILGEGIYNYAFTISHSPYGPVYFNSISKKLKADTRNGIFIVCVDPWSISSNTSNPDDSLHFREVNQALDNTWLVDINPNPVYLLQNLDGKYAKLLFQPWNFMELKKDGWLEVRLDPDSSKFNERLKVKLDDYTRYFLPYYKFSPLRFSYAIKTMDFLHQYGKVYLVRLPIHPEMQKIEDIFMPQFDSLMAVLSNHSDAYFNYQCLNDSMLYTDGNHIYKPSGAELSKRLAIEIMRESRMQ